MHAPKPLLEGAMQPLPRVFRKSHWFGVAENFDGLLRSVDDNAAILALGQMLFDLDAKRRIEHFVEIIRELGKKPFALHEFPPR